MRIPILDLATDIKEHWDEYNSAIQAVLKAGHFINGPDVEHFEREIADYLGVKHAIACNSGTDALYLGLKALDIGPGDEVIVPAFTFFATAEAVHMCGASPVFVDVEHDTYNLAVAQLNKAITKRTKAIIPVHLYGHTAQMDKILEIAAAKNLKIVEDTAQAFSAKFTDKQAGTLGHVGAYSFFPSKNLGCFGDGGLVTTDDPDTARKAKMLRSHGWEKKYYSEMIGVNSRLDTLQAAVLRVKLQYIDDATAKRRQVAQRYADLLSAIPGIVLPIEQDGHYHSFHQYTLRVLNGKRDHLQKGLAAAGIGTMVYYPVALPDMPFYEGDATSFPQSRKASEEVLSIPMGPSLSADDQQDVAKAIRSILS